MALIYDTKLKAGEYAQFAFNVYLGCDFNCVYCYSRFKDMEPRVNDLELKKDKDALIKSAGKQLKKVGYHQVNLCFVCDPYMPLDIGLGYTRKAIEDINAGGLPVQILTKGGKWSTRDFDLLKKNPDNLYGTTLTLINDKERIKWEPFAAPTIERLEALADAHNEGIKTWVSLEPVINPKDAYDLIEISHEYVDQYKIGKMNIKEDSPPEVEKLERSINWHKFKKEVIKIAEDFGFSRMNDPAKFGKKTYYIKRGLNRY